MICRKMLKSASPVADSQATYSVREAMNRCQKPETEPEEVVLMVTELAEDADDDQCEFQS